MIVDWWRRRQMIRRTHFPVLSLLFIGSLIPALPAHGDPAIIDFTGGYLRTPSGDSTHGWQFTVNLDVTLTHLGLFDYSDDGFVTDHAISLWRQSDEALLTSGMITAGTGDPLIDGFRYIGVTNVTLLTGVEYVIGFYTPTGTSVDQAYTDTITTTMDPVVNRGLRVWDWSYGMPTTEIPGDHSVIGPNFQFTETVVPAPAAVFLGALGLGVAGGWLRRGRTL